jgi:hypothetical protein
VPADYVCFDESIGALRMPSKTLYTTLSLRKTFMPFVLASAVEKASCLKQQAQ